MAAHRYWRIFVSSPDGATNNISIHHIEMYETAFGENACNLGAGAASASSFFGGGPDYEPKWAFDQSHGGYADRTGTRHIWASSSASNEWIQYDFGAGNEKDIVAIGIMSRAVSVNQSPKDFKLQWSDDGASWTDRFSLTGETGWGDREWRVYIHPDAEPTLGSNSDRGSHDYWRVLIAAASTNETNCAELEMRASSGGADQCSGGTASASSTYSGSFPPSDAFDDNNSTFWASSTNVYQAWIKYAFASAVEVYEIAYKLRPSGFTNQGPRELLIQWSDDDINWTIAWAEMDETGWTDGEQRVYTDNEAYTLATEEENLTDPPGTPTLSLDATNDDSADLSTDAFSAGGGGSHDSTQWQITTDADTGFSAPVFDSGDDATHLVDFDGAGSSAPLSPSTDYRARCRHKEDTGVYSSWSNVVTFTTAAASEPTAPTLALDSKTDTGVALSTSAFVPGSGGTHAQTQWQVTTTADTTYSSPVLDVTSSMELLSFFRATGLTAATGYRARARHQEDDGDWSAYSNEVTFTTDGAPAKPTISIVSLAGDHVVWSSSAYSGDAAQAGAHWQVTLHTDTGFASPIKDYETTAPAEFEDYTSFGLTPFEEQYIGRVRHLDANGVYSDWSDASSATSIVTSGQFYTAFAERPVGTDISTDVPSDWDEVWADDNSQWPIRFRADATCQVVDRRGQLVGDASSVDPIFWQGFPAIDQQEVFVRLIFDEHGTAPAACPGGDGSADGILCRTDTGLVDREDFTNLDDWRVVRVGPGDGFAIVTDRGHEDGDGSEQTGENALSYDHDGSFDVQPKALIVWDGAGSQPAGYYFQVAHKLIPTTHWFESCWGAIAFAIEEDDAYYTVELAHECGIFSTWDWMVIYHRLASGKIGQSRSEHPTQGWKYLKGAVDPAGTVHGLQAYGSRLGQDDMSRSDSSFAAGKVGLAINACPGQDGSGEVLFAHPTICKGKSISVIGLPDGWRLDMDISTASIAGLGVTGDGTSPKEIPFGSNAWPYETLYLYDDDGNLVTSWTDEFWGGDEITINLGGVGLGPVGGAAARLTGTPGGTDGQGYFAYLDDGQTLVLAKGDETGGLTTLGTFAYEHQSGVYYNIHLSANGTTIEAKVWSDAEGEPGSFQISVTDSDYATGAPGMVALSDTVVDFDVFAAGIGGDAYPTGRNPGTPTWLTPEVPHTVPASDPVLHLSWTRPPMTNDVLGGVVRYELQFKQEEAAGYAPLTIVSDREFYDWDTTSLPAGSYCVRVRALVGCEVGDWAEICGINIEGIAREKESPDGYFFGDWYTGQPDLGKWIRKFQASHKDDDLPVDACWVTREFLPLGVGGEALFKNAYITVTVTTAARFTVTPILDGDYLENEARTFTVQPGGTLKHERREVPFSEPYDRDNVERFRNGMRGSYLQLEICATDIGGTGRIEVDGVAIDWSKMRESHPWARPFTGELESDVELETLSRFFFGTDSDDGLEAAAYQLKPGSFDFGNRLTFLLETVDAAPAGPNGEVTFTNVYVCVTRSNEADAQLDITPIVDGDELETETVTVEGVDFAQTEVIEVPVSVPYERDGTERSRQAARGTWVKVRITNSGERPDGELVINGVAIDVHQARETAKDVALLEESTEVPE